MTADLSKESSAFLALICKYPGAKLNGGEAWSKDGTPLWPALESAGLIASVGSYRWCPKSPSLVEDALASHLAITALRAEIERLSAENDGLCEAIDVGEDGHIWRFWAKQAQEAQARATAAEAALAAKQGRKTFPILGSNGARIDYQLVADHGGQAKANHYQTVDRLAERGGLSWQELHAVLLDRKFQKVEQNTAIVECRAIEARYLSALEPTPAAHPDDAAVDRFATAMKAKLAKKRADGRGGWEGATCTSSILSELLREHVEKGDPLDVGNLAMMLHQRGERIEPNHADKE